MSKVVHRYNCDYSQCKSTKVMTIIRHVAFGAVLGILVKRSESIN